MRIALVHLRMNGSASLASVCAASRSELRLQRLQKGASHHSRACAIAALSSLGVVVAKHHNSEFSGEFRQDQQVTITCGSFICEQANDFARCARTAGVIKGLCRVGATEAHYHWCATNKLQVIARFVFQCQSKVLCVIFPSPVLVYVCLQHRKPEKYDRVGRHPA